MSSSTLEYRTCRDSQIPFYNESTVHWRCHRKSQSCTLFRVLGKSYENGIHRRQVDFRLHLFICAAHRIVKHLPQY